MKAAGTSVKLYFMLGLPTETEEDMKGIAVSWQRRLQRRYYEIPKEQRNGKCQMYVKHFLLCTEAIYSVPVGTDVYQGGILAQSLHCKT